MNPRYSAVAKRAGHRCEYCSAPEVVFNFPFEVEHIIPPGAGGDDDLANLALSCRSCNVFKAAVVFLTDEETAVEVRLFHPRQDQWPEHFHLGEDGQGLRVARVLAFETGLDFPEANPVSRSQRHHARNRSLIHATAVRGIKILEMENVADAIDLRVTSRDRGIVDLDEVIRAATDSDQLFRQFMRDRRRAGR